LRAHFDEAALIALTHIVTLENLRARFNLALGIASSGVCGVQVCASPDAG
jgi:4-carboxymuconolactone decarboxylase